MKYKRYTLKELATIKYGKNQAKVVTIEKKYPIYGTGGLMGYATQFLYDKPSVLIGRKGTIDKIRYVEHPFWTVDTLFYTEINTDIVIPEYFYYALSLIDLAKHNEGTTIPSLRTDTLNKIEFDIPDIEEQRKIIGILRPISDKIALNEQINNNLEQQATILFSSLYERATTGVRYTDLIQILGGGTPKTGENTYWNGAIAFFTPKDVGSPYTLITEKTITEEGLSHCNSRLYPVNTVFVTARGTVGKVGMSGVPMAMNQSCYALVGKETHQLLVYFYTLKAVDRLKHKASGAVFDAITTRDFESEQIMKLSDDDSKAFLCVAEPIYQAILNNSIENLRLSTLRNSLLPKLMTGEIDISAVKF